MRISFSFKNNVFTILFLLCYWMFLSVRKSIKSKSNPQVKLPLVWGLALRSSNVTLETGWESSAVSSPFCSFSVIECSCLFESQLKVNQTPRLNYPWFGGLLSSLQISPLKLAENHLLSLPPLYWRLFILYFSWTSAISFWKGGQLCWTIKETERIKLRTCSAGASCCLGYTMRQI